MEEDSEKMRRESQNASHLQKESEAAAQKIDYLSHELQTVQVENQRLGDDLQRQQKLFNELKKMRGRGEEMDLLQESQEVRPRRNHRWRR